VGLLSLESNPHNGFRIASLWIGTLVLCYLYESTLWGIFLLASGVAVVTTSVWTYQWLTAPPTSRARTLQPAVDQPQQPSGAFPADISVSAEEIGSAICDLVWVQSQEKGTYTSVLKGVPASQCENLHHEIVALRAAGAQAAVAEMLRGNESDARVVLDVFYTTLTTRLSGGGADKRIFASLTARTQHYYSALTVTEDKQSAKRLASFSLLIGWTGNPVQDVGLLFALYLGDPEDIRLTMAGSGMFVETLGATRSYLERIA
jgi:hypothetical protein